MKISAQSAANLARLREYLTPGLLQLYQGLIDEAEELDGQFLKAGELVLDARATAARLRIPLRTFYQRLQRLEEAGLILRTRRVTTIVTIIAFSAPIRNINPVETPNVPASHPRNTPPFPTFKSSAERKDERFQKLLKQYF